jgi:hypothetical protein
MRRARTPHVDSGGWLGPRYWNTSEAVGTQQAQRGAAGFVAWMAFSGFACYDAAMSVPCPKCRRPLEPSGELDADGQTMTVYQCDHCTVPWRFGRAEFPTALTFALDADGNYLDAETLDPLPPFVEPSDN